MSWAKITAKNKDKEQEIIVKEKKNEQKIYDPYSHLMFKNIDDEFEYRYLNKMSNISVQFRDFISKHFLPFMDKIIYVNYTTYDFIKENSYEYNIVENYVNNYNQELINEYEKENEELERELAEEEYISD